MSLANKITLGRAALIPFILLLFCFHQRIAAFGLFFLACAGDVLDGMVARRRGEVTTWGKALDPLVDKALYVSLLISFFALGEISVLAFVLFLLPQVGLGVGAIWLHLRSRIVQGSRGIGKAAAAVTFIAIFFYLLELPYRMWALYGAIASSYLAGFDYLYAGLRATGSHRKDNRGSLAG
jgi:CDP-diacylglycerol--glycerol-3-phosphate 3-phosphatidyltransferase